MSDINISNAVPVVNVKLSGSLESRRDVSRTGNDVIETATNEVGSLSAQVTAGENGEASSKNSEKDRDPLERAAETLQRLIPETEIANTSLRIDQDKDTGRFVYFSVDNDSGEVVKQFPPEDILKFLSSVRGVSGIAVDDRA